MMFDHVTLQDKLAQLEELPTRLRLQELASLKKTKVTLDQLLERQSQNRMEELKQMRAELFR